jgi:tetratricopeptide (TPR) repeat protein
MSVSTGDDLARAAALVRDGHHKQAGELAGAYLAEHPDEPLALVLVAQAELGLLDWGRAESAAARAVELAPDNGSAHQVLARALLGRAYTRDLATRRGVRDQALAEAREALRLAPMEVAGLLLAAQAATMAQHLPEAMAYTDQAVQCAPDHVGSWVARADIARQSGDLDVAEASAREALRLEPRGTVPNSTLALVLKDRGDDAGFHKYQSVALLNMFLGVARGPAPGDGERDR